MDDMDQGGAGGAPLHDDTPQNERRRPTRQGHGGGKQSAGRDASAGDPAAAAGKDGGEEAKAGDALGPSPRAQRDSARGE
ncbi:hypothetical protein ACFVGY_11790 [Streptomyces sp. NPDC127106]|uniref:hypothetical protein n=1 Tax=Streptomyces sp. NPDC127106 TaxID=3345360 RepID=UPI003628FC79